MSEPLQHSPRPFTFHRDGWYIEDAEGNPIVEVNSAYPGDGHLFAAAPDMLRLLRVFAAGELRRAGIAELRAAHAETADLITRLDGVE